jgi:hypothetical protein
METQLLLERVAAQGLENSSRDEVVSLARAYWHEGFSPDLDRILRLPSDQQKMAGYLTEFFSMFYCMEEERALALVDISNRIKAAVAPNHEENDNDKLAAEWGLVETINTFLPDILPYQTRHYRK